MIKAIFTGGLGNQMFQYAYIYAQIRKNNLNKNIYAVMFHNPNEDQRNFSINALSCSIHMKVVDYKNAKVIVKIQHFMRRCLSRIFRDMHTKDNIAIKIFSKFNICFLPTIYTYYPNLILRKNNYVEGTFQSWKYFHEYRDELIQEFTISKKIEKKNEAILEKIQSTNSVCVHIRRGDYLNSAYANDLNICNYEYYKKSMDYIASKVKNPVFYVFSNSHKDLLWIKKNYHFEYDIVYVDNENVDYEELRLMSSCKHFILSNSSFSWWAQYLSNYEQKCVTAPSKWHNGKDIDDQDIYLADWKIIDI